jgi:hypothetical protein
MATKGGSADNIGNFLTVDPNFENPPSDQNDGDLAVEHCGVRTRSIQETLINGGQILKNVE